MLAVLVLCAGLLSASVTAQSGGKPAGHVPKHVMVSDRLGSSLNTAEICESVAEDSRGL